MIEIGFSSIAEGSFSHGFHVREVVDVIAAE